MPDPGGDAPAALARLAGQRGPALIGVRHHSAALARAMPAMLDALRPARVLVELPSDLDPWLAWLSHPEAEAPLALAAAGADGGGLCFLPFADFSPELAALRWARRHDVPVHGIDLPCDRRADLADRAGGGSGLQRILRERSGVDADADLWDRLVEAPAAAADPEALRRAALAVGWAWRQDAPAGDRDLVREAWMRSRIAGLGAEGAVAIVGSFHAAALLPAAAAGSVAIPPAGAAVVGSLIPYAFDQFDERSGYGAGIRDPAWHQAAWSASGPDGMDAALVRFAVAICRRMRGGGHLASPADAREMVRVARDLARLRGLPAPGRGELVEAAQAVLARGEVVGAGRAVAAALEAELVGQRRGRLPPGCPRSGLAPAVEGLLASLGLPGPEALGDEPRDLRLDGLGSDLDRLRTVVCERLRLLDVPYADPIGSAAAVSGAEHLTRVWRLRWTAATAATLEVAARRGATMEQAAQGALAAAASIAADPAGDLPPAAVLELAGRAARCGLGPACDGFLLRLLAPGFLDRADLPCLVAALALIQRLARGLEPGLQGAAAARPGIALPGWRLPDGVVCGPLALAAERCLEGLAGSDRVEDVAGLLDLWAWWISAAGQDAPGDGRLRWILRRMHGDGGPLMQGAAAGLLVLAGERATDVLGEDLAGWISAAVDAGGRHALRRRFAGLLLAADSLLAADPAGLDAAHRVLAGLGDAEFLARLPALRAGALALSPAARGRLLAAILDRHGAAARGQLSDDPLLLSAWASADAAADAAVVRLLGACAPPPAGGATGPAAGAAVAAGGAMAPADRWRLVLGDPRRDDAPARRLADALEQCYGRGRGEGERGIGGGAGGGGAGDGAPDPDVRAWDEEVARLFGGDVREEVVADRALSMPAALTLLDPGRVTPSVELLERVLALKGSLPAGAGSHLRALARRLVDELARELARRLAPSLSGLGVARPTRRRSPRLDLRATVRANLDSAVPGPDGPQLAVRRLRWLARARREMDWHLVLVVDVSGSMEASTIHSALLASVFARLPALSVEFLAFSTEVVDFTARVGDPLDLLLEVRIGGGTRIGLGLRRARERLRVPRRSMVVVVSDFDEGVSSGEMLAEVRALRDSGARMIGLAALDARGHPRYHAGIAAQVAAAGMPVAALSPQHVARWVAQQMR